MRRTIWLSFCFVAAFAASSYAQISPGALYSGHSQLEGIDNCTKCHTVGRLLSNGKCIACHKEIGTRISQNVGYHATVSTKSCTECHLDHLGRTYQIIRFDTSSFNHATVGFILKGKHKTTCCRQCHAPQNIAAPDIKILPVSRRETTYLGLSTTCESCHADAHNGQFNQACSSCHNTEHWEPADNFNHDRTGYPLTGKHKDVNCYQCHNKKMSDGKTVKFVGLQFSSCSNCHADPHRGQFKQPLSLIHI